MSNVRISLAVITSIVNLFGTALLFANSIKISDRLESRNIGRTNETIMQPISNQSLNIAIVVVVTDLSLEEKYHTALETMRCYAKIHSYQLLFVADVDYDCHHKDKFFRRHCVVAKILPRFDAVLFLDADTGVVNPSRKIEEFLKPGIDITFVNRFCNWEIASGFYLARNTPFAINLLNNFADYESKLPNSFHGTDNGAIHIFLAEKIFPQASIEIGICRRAYEKSTSVEDLILYEACIKALFGVVTDFGKIQILRKGTGWARDGWLTSMVWHPETDFMLHGWKTNALIPTPTDPLVAIEMSMSQWFKPLNGSIDLSKCNSHNSTWNYDARLLGNNKEIQKSLHRIQKENSILQVKAYSDFSKFISL